MKPRKRRGPREIVLMDFGNGARLVRIPGDNGEPSARRLRARLEKYERTGKW